MRLVRLGALFGSLMLLVATTVSLVDQRSEIRREQDRDAVAAVVLATDGVESAVERAGALAVVASADTDPADLVRTFDGDPSACVGTGADVRCTGADLVALSAFGTAASRSVEAAGAAVAVVDSSSASVLVVARGSVTAVIQLPTDTLRAAVDEEAVETYGAEIGINVAASDAPTDRIGEPMSIDGDRAVAAILGADIATGSIEIVASVDGGVALGGENPALFGALLALGTVLLALAAWTFLVERRQLERRATTDELTGLANRREFERVTREALLMAERFGTGMCVMLIDLNGFKEINDTYGHQFGDLVLKGCAERLRHAVRDTDVVGRWGGDEFVIMLPGIEDGTAVRNSAERIGGSLAASPVVGDVRVSGSIGAALYPRHGASFEALIRAADEAMYGAKSTGVTHRLADALAAEAEEQTLPLGYHGPERRGRRAGDRSDDISIG